jgi:hypothetical protein
VSVLLWEQLQEQTLQLGLITFFKPCKRLQLMVALKDWACIFLFEKYKRLVIMSDLGIRSQ